jgi:DNA-binding MarR family transcriptional regulator
VVLNHTTTTTTKPMTPAQDTIKRLQSSLTTAAALIPGGMFIHHLQILLHVAEHGPSTYKELEDAMQLSNASISRSVNAMSNYARHRQDALGLLIITRDPQEGRRYLVSLTRKGLAMIKLIAAPWSN